MTPIVLYTGPSMLDGAPIVAIATIGSSNAKTGPMVQTWILRADLNPLEASAQGADASVCGQCPRRHSLGGDCYVVLIQAPRAVHAAWVAAGMPGENWSDESNVVRMTQAARDHGFRMGSYGDPAAVPFHIWRDVLDALQPKLQTGYTHQWGTLYSSPVGVFSPSTAHADWFRDNVMASCDTVSEADLARALGWRYFLAVTPATVPHVPEKTILCLAEREGDKARTCETCGICDGAQGKPGRASVYLVEHGGRAQAKHKRSAALAVLS